MKKLVGLYTGSSMLIEHPDYFDALKQEIGLTHVIGGGDYRLSGETWAKNPMPPGDEQFAPSRGGDDDTPFRRALEVAHDKGCDLNVKRYRSTVGRYHQRRSIYDSTDYIPLPSCHFVSLPEKPDCIHNEYQPGTGKLTDNQSQEEWFDFPIDPNSPYLQDKKLDDPRKKD